MYIDELVASADTVPSSTSDKCSNIHTLRMDPVRPKAAAVMTVEEYADHCATLLGENPGKVRRADDGGAAFLHSVDAWQRVVFFHKPIGRWMNGRVRIRVTLYPDPPKATL
jgi:hypothetical protein